MRIPTDFCVNQQKETIVQILTDHIIFERIYTGMQEVTKAANPTCEDFDPVHFYNGFANAWIFLVAYELPDEVEEALKDELSDIFFKYFREDLAKPYDQRKTAIDLANHIFIDWETTIDKAERRLRSA
ncbi:hypothetical protein FHG64_16090 [Antarcticibacterium flavum]|uniref:Uncharacterized protein n=1 Tax=Antarcticibacterium flavum TaxID=2058175 RepID=A0A5B7X5Z4_9FLAO|nr:MULTISPECIES: hypothetical protein [Antarcticibacterium]MCM4159536.1 hypothetical protein [Antarcticibacterium sp. W02-3]QCY70789.1 hypothetical protein FHG64_16090 [Antarcticibacterium flavum]